GAGHDNGHQDVAGSDDLSGDEPAEAVAYRARHLMADTVLSAATCGATCGGPAGVAGAFGRMARAACRVSWQQAPLLNCTEKRPAPSNPGSEGLAGAGAPGRK